MNEAKMKEYSEQILSEDGVKSVMIVAHVRDRAMASFLTDEDDDKKRERELIGNALAMTLAIPPYLWERLIVGLFSLIQKQIEGEPDQKERAKMAQYVIDALDAIGVDVQDNENQDEESVSKEIH